MGGLGHYIRILFEMDINIKYKFTGPDKQLKFFQIPLANLRVSDESSFAKN